MGVGSCSSNGKIPQNRWESCQRSNRIIQYLGTLTVTQGAQAGNPLRVLPWQKTFILSAFADGVSEATLTMARGAGKSTLMAGIALAHIDCDGVAEPASETTIIAGTEKQGRILFEHAARFAEHLDKPYLKIHRNVTLMKIRNLDTNAELKVMAANPRGLHGSAPGLVLCDEVAQWNPSQSEAIVAALRTGLGKIPNSRLVAIGTRGAQSGDLWDTMIRQADYSQIHAATDQDSPFQRRTWAKACPSLRDSTRELFADLETQYRRESKRAKEDPRVMQSFKALRLNMGISDTVEAYVLDPRDYERMVIKESEFEVKRPYILGVDLGSGNAMSAIAAYSLESECLDVRAMFPNHPNLLERGKLDGVGMLYRRMEARGELQTIGGYVSDVSALIEWATHLWGIPATIVCDRWRKDELFEGLHKINYPVTKVVTRGQGYKDGSLDLRAFRKLCLSGHVKVKENLLFVSALNEARTVPNPGTGEEKLAKATEGGRRSRAKDDAVAAAILAVSEGSRATKPAPNRLSLGIAR